MDIRIFGKCAVDDDCPLNENIVRMILRPHVHLRLEPFEPESKHLPDTIEELSDRSNVLFLPQFSHSLLQLSLRLSNMILRPILVNPPKSSEYLKYLIDAEGRNPCGRN